VKKTVALKNHFIVLILVVFLFKIDLIGQDGYFQLRGRVYDKFSQSMGDVKFEVFENTVSIDSYKTSPQGNFSIRLKLNKKFTIEISKAGFASKRIAVDTNVPEEKSGQFFDELTFIVIFPESEADLQSKSGLPVMKYFYKTTESRFIAEELGTKSDNVLISQDLKALEELKEELGNYKKLYFQQKTMLREAERIISDANLIRSEAVNFADSIVRNANNRAYQILKSAKVDSASVVSAFNKTTRDISSDEYKKLAIDEKEFLNKNHIKELKQRINRINQKQVISEKDSLLIKKDRLSMRKELFEMAQYQLEIDRLNARTREDSLRIEQRESELLLLEQNMLFAEQELENANNKLLLKDLELKNKNIQLFSVLGGSVLLLILLGFIYYNYRDKKRINKILEYQNQELEKLSIVASETSNAVIITDELGNFMWVNKGYTRMFGFKPDEVTGDNSKCIIGPSNGDAINALIGKARINGEPVSYEFEANTKDGNKIWVQTTLTPIKNKNGEVTKLIAIDSDISQIKEAEFEILKQSKQLARQNAQIMDSITYAKRIQDAMLPSEDLIRSYFSDCFIYFKPRDIVSGDFYWFSVQDEKLFIAAVDCTGHGVPGAFMSLIGNSLLNHIVNERKIHNPAQILKQLNNGVNAAFSQSGQVNEEREDGMDLTLCSFDKNKKELQIACANHTAIIVSNGSIHEVQGDEISIGEAYAKIENLEFKNHTYPFKENSVIYLFSDGYQDQIGGPKNKKFMAGNFISFLTDSQGEAMNMQFDKLNEKFQEWKGNNKQTDDVLVMGLKIS
jgi:PAS domain S-box-containing protein